MKDKKLKVMILTFSIVALLLLSSFSTLGAYNESDTESQKPNGKCSISVVGSISNPTMIKSYDFNVLSDPDFNNSENIVITNETANETYPSMVVGGYRALIAYENDFFENTSYLLRHSRDYGQSWSSAWKLEIEIDDEEVEVKSPSLSVSPGTNYVHGAFISTFNNSGVNGVFSTPNVGEDLGIVDAIIVDWSVYEFYNFTNPDIVAYDNTTAPWVMILTGSTNYVDPDSGLGPCNNSPMFVFKGIEDSAEIIYIVWFPGIQNCSNISIANDYGDETVYGVCEIQNGSQKDLIFFEGNPESWLEEEYLRNQTFYFPGVNFSHPQIFVNNDDIYVITEVSGMFEGEMNYDIGIIYSEDGGENWDVISPLDYDLFPPNETMPKFPDILVNETQIFCTFVESNNIYVTNSSTGENWSIPIQLNSENDSVVEEYRFCEMPTVDHVIWTDNREGNKDIYSILRALPEIDLAILPESVKIMGGEWDAIPTQNWLEFTVKNNGTAYVTDVYIEITYNCTGKNPRKTAYQGYIPYLDGNGAEKTLKRPLFRFSIIEFVNALLNFIGIQNVTITVDPDNLLRDSDRSNNAYTLENVTYGKIFPNFAWLEDIF